MEVDDHPNNFRRFFRIIVEPDRDLKKLILLVDILYNGGFKGLARRGVHSLDNGKVIPIKFMAKYGSDLSDVVSLKFPTGKTWNVKLLKENGRAWFNDGWHEIVTYYSICPGHFLMFTYGGTSRFNVHIFDMTTCEIEYPLDSHEPREIQKTVRETKTKANHTMPTLSKENEMLTLIKQYRRKFGGVTRKVIKKINSYQFENPSFAIVMHPSYVTDTGNKFRVRIPSKIAREYFTNTGGMSCTLQNATGDTWPVRCNGSSPKLMKISCGWKEFASDNKLRVNDICVFELIDADECLFKVEIIRHSSPASSVGVGVAGPSTYTI